MLRLKEEQDGAEPSANSVSVFNLVRLAAYTENAAYTDLAVKVTSAYKETLTRFPVALPEMACGLMALNKHPIQVIISGQDEAKVGPFFKAVQALLLPQKILVHAHGGKKASSSFLYNKMAILKSIPVEKEGVKAYVCRNMACSEPVTTLEGLVNLITKK